jgi:TolB protein
VFQVDLDTNEESPILEEFGLVGHIVESPDGGTLLFVRFNSETEDISNLWTCTVEGKEQKVVTRDAGLQYDPAWSHDGKKIVYVSGHGYQTHELYTIDSDGKNKQKLTNNKALELLPAFSADNKKIAYSSDNTGDFEIWLMDPDGSDPRQLTDSDGIDTRPCWSPDGNRIMFVSNRNGNQQIWIMNKDGSDPRQLTTGAPSIDPAWKKE